jgi:hypothetical protein
MTVHIKERTFATNREKAAYMLDRSIADAQLPAVQHWANVFRQLPVDERPGAIFRFVQWAIDYVRDPGQEVLEDAATVLLRGYGDCDAKSRTFVALCVASGIPARGLPVRLDDGFPHIAAEVYVGGQWQKADPTILNSAIGQVPAASSAITNYW